MQFDDARCDGVFLLEVPNRFSCARHDGAQSVQSGRKTLSGRSLRQRNGSRSQALG